MLPRPSILLVMCDQLNAGALSCYGGPVPTPHLDRLAHEGVLFTDATCPTPFCSPSRASLLTGMYPHRHGIVGNVNRRDYPAIPAPATQQGIKADDVTTERLLNAAGYETHHYGKWHLMDDDLPYYPDMFGEHHEYARAMEAVFGAVRKQPRGDWMEWYGWAMPVAVSPELLPVLADLGDHWNDRRHAEFITKMGRLRLPVEQVFDAQVTDRAVQAIGSAVEPCMVTCSFNYPHDPNVVPSPYYEEIDPAALPLPGNVDYREDRFERDWSRQIVADLGDVGLREFLRIYYASVRLVDDQVGRLLGALDRSGRSDNTIVVFTSDHGDMAGGHGMVWKSTSSFYDEVARVPLIIRYPRALQPQRTSLAAGLTDLMPTLLDLTGHPVPEGLDGHSLAPYVTGAMPADAAPHYTFCERVSPNRQHTRVVEPGTPASFMVRGAGFKYCRFADGTEFLYDLSADPGETRNVIGDPAFANAKETLRQELSAWLERTQYPV